MNFCNLKFDICKIDIRKSRIENLKEVNTRKFLCLYSIKSMELVEKTELLRRCLSMLYQRFI